MKNKKETQKAWLKRIARQTPCGRWHDKMSVGCPDCPWIKIKDYPCC